MSTLGCGVGVAVFLVAGACSPNVASQTDLGDGLSGDPVLAADASTDLPNKPALPDGPPFFLLHWSDVHIGSGAFAKPAFHFALTEIRAAFQGVPIVVSGDLVEWGTHADDWSDYKTMVDEAGLSVDTYIDGPGNHDSYEDDALSGYLANSLVGRQRNELYGIHVLHGGGKTVRLLMLNSASGGDIARNSTGYVASEQVDDLLARLAADPLQPDATLVVAHHPMDSLDGLQFFGTDSEVQRLLDATNAVAFLHGHLHMYTSSWNGWALLAQAPSIGNPASNQFIDQSGFNLFAIDDGPSVKTVNINGDLDNLSVDWPVVFITRPARRALTSSTIFGDINPWATGLPRGSGDYVLRAAVFAPGAIEDVTFHVDDGPALPMVQQDNYYEAHFATPDADTCVITVSARSAGHDSEDTVRLKLR